MPSETLPRATDNKIAPRPFSQACKKTICPNYIFFLFSHGNEQKAVEKQLYIICVEELVGFVIDKIKAMEWKRRP